jgi:WD40 repeat protein
MMATHGSALYEQPVLVIDPDTHTAPIKSVRADAQGRFLLSTASDGTARTWDCATGTLLRTIRVPLGPPPVGELYAGAISPDGDLLAVGGYTGPSDNLFSVFLFARENGALLSRIDGLPNAINDLAFSPDGMRLAVLLGGTEGLWLIDPFSKDVFFRDGYPVTGHRAKYDSRGRLVTTSRSAAIRVYDWQGDSCHLHLIRAQGFGAPRGIAFSPDGRQFAIGYTRGNSVDIFDATQLTRLFAADTAAVDHGNLSAVAWLDDGTLCAAGQWTNGDQRLLRCWADGGRSAPFDLPLSSDTVLDLCALPGSRLAFASHGARLGVLGLDGQKVWEVGPPIPDLRNQREIFALAPDGSEVRFGYAIHGKTTAVFSARDLGFAADGPERQLTVARTNAPDLVINSDRWKDGHRPTLNGALLQPLRDLRAYGVAVGPNADRFAVAAALGLYMFDHSGTELWRRAGRGAFWAVNISADGRLVVAFCADGTIRWYTVEEGTELLAVLPFADRTSWVAWTPRGLYAATPGARGVLRWWVNQGWDKQPEAIPVHEIVEQHRPDVLRVVLRERDEVRALGIVALEKVRSAFRRHIGVEPPGRLHVLAVGISQYNEEHASGFHLRYADADARDVYAALTGSQRSLYAEVCPQELRNKDAHRENVLMALDTIKRATAKAPGQDLVVIHFSGHGYLVDGELYLYCYDVKPRSPPEIKSSALSFSMLRGELLTVAKSSRVLLLLDVCFSGMATMDDPEKSFSTTAALGAGARNVTILASTAGAEPALEEKKWGHGAFTMAFLDALRSHADRDHDGLLSMGDIVDHMQHKLPELTGGRQRLGVEMRFGGSIFVAGL